MNVFTGSSIPSPQGSEAPHPTLLNEHIIKYAQSYSGKIYFRKMHIFSGNKSMLKTNNLLY